MKIVEKELNELLGESIELVTTRQNKTFDLLAFPFGRSLVLVGAGNFGKQVLHCLRKDGIEPLAFADGNPDLQGTSIEGVQVLSRVDAAKRYGNSAAFVVTIWNSGDSFLVVREELLNLGCAKVLSSIPLRWKYADSLLPYLWIDLPSRTLLERDQIEITMSLWSDEYSRAEYVNQLKFRLLADFESIDLHECSESYFPDDLFILASDENFIDCGAFNGITIRQFLSLGKDFKGKIVAYEPDVSNFRLLEQFVNSIQENEPAQIIPLPSAVGSTRSKVHFDATGTMGSTISKHGAVLVDCVTLDESLRGLEINPSFIKMDIEGGELDALVGASGLIHETKPILAICLYHRFNDLWQIPAYIHSLVPEYSLYLRSHEIESRQLVCYAVPPSRLRSHHQA